MGSKRITATAPEKSGLSSEFTLSCLFFIDYKSQELFMASNFVWNFVESRVHFGYLFVVLNDHSLSYLCLRSNHSTRKAKAIQLIMSFNVMAFLVNIFLGSGLAVG